MPKVTAPLLSLSASGTFGRTLNYANFGTRQIARAPKPTLRSRTTRQRIKKTNSMTRMLDMVRTWDSLDAAQRQVWRDYAVNSGLTGYQWFWKAWFAQRCIFGDLPHLP